MRVGVTRAFTLVELLGVMLVLGLIAGAAVPALSGVSRARERSDRDAAGEALRLARAMAVASETPHAAAFFGPDREILVERWSPLRSEAEPAVDPLGGVVPASSARADAVARIGNRNVTARGERVWFGAGGTPVEPGAHPVTGEPAAEPIVLVFESGGELSVEPRTGAILR